MAFITGRSGFSQPADFEKPNPPELITATGQVTAREILFVLAKGNITQRFAVDDVVIDTPSYLKDGVFVAPVILETGLNSVELTSISVRGGESEPRIFTATRKDRTLDRDVLQTFIIDGIDLTDYVDSPKLSKDRDSGITEITANLTGKFFPENSSWLRYNSQVEYTYSDGLVEKSAKARIDWFKDKIGEKGERNVEIKATSQVKRLLEFTLTKSLTGKFNGDILQEICSQAGFKNVYTPKGNKYTGPRSVNDRKSIEIIKNIRFVDQLMMFEIDNETIMFLPDYFANFEVFTFQDDEIQIMERELDGSFILNKGRIKYIPPDEDINQNYNLEANVPDKSQDDTTPEGNSFYLTDGFDTVVTAYDPDSVIFFGAWSDKIDFNNIKQAVVKLQFNESVIGVSTFNKQIDLQPYPDRKIAVGYFDLRLYHLAPEVPIYWDFFLEDYSGNTFGSKSLSENGKPEWKILKLNASQTGSLSSIVTAFDVQMTDDKLLKTIDLSWEINNHNNLPNSSETVIVYSNYEAFKRLDVDGWKFEFLLEIPFNDSVLKSLHFDLEQAKISYIEPVVLRNCSIHTENNPEIGGHKYFFAVRVHEPNAPVKRVDKAYIKFTGEVLQGETIAVKFNVWGRDFLSSADYEDYTKIDFEYQNDESINLIKEISEEVVIDDGIRDGGAILSSYLSSFKQSENLLKKVIDARSGILNGNIAGIEIHTISVPPLIELTENQLIKVVSVEAGIAYYYWIVEKTLEDYYSTIKAMKITEVEINRINTDAKTKRKAVPDIDISLAAILDDLIPERLGILRGTVSHQKYRGVYTVRLDTGEEITKVNTRLEDVKSGDTVLVAQTKEGNYIIVAIISANFNENLLDELLGSEEEREEWQNEQDNDPDNDDLRRPMGNILTIKSLEADRFEDFGDGDEVPLNVNILIEFSHPMSNSKHNNGFFNEAKAQSIANSMRGIDWKYSSNISLFFYAYVEAQGDEPQTNLAFFTNPLNEDMTRFYFTPIDLSNHLGKTLVVGFGNVVGGGFINSQINQNLKVRSRRGAAFLPDEVKVEKRFKVEPKFIIDSVEHTSPYNITLTFNQFLSDDTEPIENPRNYFIDVGDN